MSEKTPEREAAEAQRRREVNERSRLMSERGIPSPQSGTFGKPGPPPKPKGPRE